MLIIIDTGFVPMILTSDVHPSGIYSIHFVSSAGDEDTVIYNMTSRKTDGNK